MNKLRRIIMLLVCAASLTLSVVNVVASPINMEPNQYNQPSGTVIYVYGYGDEFYNFEGDMDGYLLKKGEDGAYYYITSQGESIVASGESSRPANAVKGFDFMPQITQVSEEDFAPVEDENDGNAVSRMILDDTKPTVKPFAYTNNLYGTRKLLVVLVDFTDVQVDTQLFSGQTLYNKYFSTAEGVESVSNYFLEQSKNRFTFEPAFTAAEVNQADGKITDSNLDDQYGVLADGIIKINTGAQHPHQYGVSSAAGCVKVPEYALPALDPYIDFAQFDTTQTVGRITPSELTVFFIVAGYERSGNRKDANGNNLVPNIWAHRALCRKTVDDINIFYYSQDGYACQGAMLDATTPMQINTACHELGHTLDFADLYATPVDYSDIGNISLMNYSWCKDQNNRYVPNGLDPLHKFYRGWYEDDDVLILNENSEGIYEIVSHYSGNDGYEYVKICNSNNPNEYFVLENRKFEGSDISLQRGHASAPNEEGIAIWRIREDVFNRTYLSTGSFSNSLPAGMTLLRSGKEITGSNTSTGALVYNTYSGASFYNVNKPFWSKGVNRFTFFNDLSYPDSKFYSSNTATESGIQIEFLSEPGADRAKIKVGGNGVKTSVSVRQGNTQVHLFNNTAEQVNKIPAIVEYSDSEIINVLEFERISAGAGEVAVTSAKTFTYDNGDEFNTLLLDSPWGNDEPQTPTLTLNQNSLRAGLADDMTAIAESYVLFNEVEGATYKNNGADAVLGTAPEGMVALKVNAGENSFTAVKNNSTSNAVVITGVDLYTDSEVPSVTNFFTARHTAVTNENIYTGTQQLYQRSNGSVFLYSHSVFESTDNAYDEFMFSIDAYVASDNNTVNGDTGYSSLFNMKNSSSGGGVRQHILIKDGGAIALGSATTLDAAATASVETGYSVTLNAWHTYKVVVHKATGNFDLYVDDVLVAKDCRQGEVETFANGAAFFPGSANENIYYKGLSYAAHIMS